MFFKASLAIFVIALSLTPPLPSNGQRPRQPRPVAYWEGKIRIEKTYKDTVGEYRWTGEYRVLLAETVRRKLVYHDDPRNVTSSKLEPLELDYAIEAAQTLNSGCFQEPSAEIVAGRASGALRLNSLR
jgi:hypothetical protein